MNENNGKPTPDAVDLDQASAALQNTPIPSGPPPEVVVATLAAINRRLGGAVPVRPATPDGPLSPSPEVWRPGGLRCATPPSKPLESPPTAFSDEELPGEESVLVSEEPAWAARIEAERTTLSATRYRCSVLVVDDDPAVLAVLSGQLRADFDVATAGTAGQARAVLARRSVDVILSDLQLPDESGLSLLDWVRKTAPRTARVLITGTARLEDAADAINRTQVHRLVLKPWQSDDLLQTLRATARALLLERSHEQLLDEHRRLNLELEKRVADRTRELQSALALLDQKNQILEEMALTDPLTGLPNRRAIDRVIQGELARRGRMPTPLTLAMIDADHFKQINTEHLHAGGDHVLTWLAGVLKNSIRSTDSIARVGGEEFLLIAPGTDAPGASVLAERLRSAVEAAPTDYAGRSIGVTISLGVAVVEEGVPAAYDPLQKCAQVALREAKDAGRNRAVVRPYTPTAW